MQTHSIQQSIGPWLALHPKCPLGWCEAPRRAITTTPVFLSPQEAVTQAAAQFADANGGGGGGGGGGIDNSLIRRMAVQAADGEAAAADRALQAALEARTVWNGALRQQVRFRSGSMFVFCLFVRSFTSFHQGERDVSQQLWMHLVFAKTYRAKRLYSALCFTFPFELENGVPPPPR
jgi:hypothetical protein